MDTLIHYLLPFFLSFLFLDRSNKTVTVEVTTMPSSPLGEDANTLEKVAYKMRARGLKITELLDYQE